MNEEEEEFKFCDASNSEEMKVDSCEEKAEKWNQSADFIDEQSSSENNDDEEEEPLEKKKKVVENAP